MGVSHRGHGRGKLLLFGEHAAVKGHPALGLALARGVAVILEPDETAPAWSLEGFDEKERAIARAVMARIDAAIPGLPAGGRIRVEGDLPQGRGFGSSAALCVALAEAALGAAGTPEAIRHRALVWSIAHHAEAYFHGSPSGIDTGLATLGGLVAFRPRPPDLPEARRLDRPVPPLLVGSLPRVAESRELIARVREASASPGSYGDLALARLGERASAATFLFESCRPGRGLEAGALAELGRLADEAEGDLEGLGLVDAGVARLLEAGRRRGALGGKMSGAGGGGAFFLLYPDGEAAAEARRLLGEEAGRLGLGSLLSLETLGGEPPPAGR